MSAPKIVLSYWDGFGRLTPAILAFKSAGIPFERETFTPETWPAASQDRARFPLGDIPVMNVDGRVISESHAIATYAGVLTNTWPKEAFESARTLEVVLTIEEIFTGMWGANFMKTFLHPMVNPDLTAEKQKELREGPFQQHLVFYARRVNDIILQNGDNGYTVGNALSIADFMVAQIAHQFSSGQVDHVPVTVLSEFTGIAKVAATVEAVESLKEIIAEMKQ